MHKRGATTKQRTPVPPTPKTGPGGAPAARGPAGNGQQVPEKAIRILAYQKWEAAGCPDGDGVNFWLEAERELRRAE
jgi:hypothetical protein